MLTSPERIQRQPNSVYAAASSLWYGLSGSSMAALHYHPSLMRNPALNQRAPCIISTPCLHMLSFGARRWAHHLTELVAPRKRCRSLASRLDTFHSFQRKRPPADTTCQSRHLLGFRFRGPSDEALIDSWAIHFTQLLWKMSGGVKK